MLCGREMMGFAILSPSYGLVRIASDTVLIGMRMNNSSDLVIFDCDGVLVDSEPMFNRAHAAILSQSGYEITPELLGERFCGISDADIAGLNIPTGIPLAYELDENFKPLNPGGTYLDPEAAAAAIEAVKNQGKKK